MKAGITDVMVPPHLQFFEIISDIEWPNYAEGEK